MKTNAFIAAVALTLAAAAGPVLAQEATYDYPQAVASQTTRAAVLAELKALRADGQVLVSEAHVGLQANPQARTLPQRSREAVRAEARAAMQSGLTHSLTAEPYGFTVAVQTTAAPVQVAAK